MSTQNAQTNWPKNSGSAQQSQRKRYSYIDEYEKHRRYYFRDYDDRYQLDSYNEQQFERIFGNTFRPQA
jgi:hypothetical protein